MHSDAAMAKRTTVLYSGGGSVSIAILGSGFLGSGRSGSIPLTKAPSGFGRVCSVIGLDVSEILKGEASCSCHGEVLLV